MSLIANMTCYVVRSAEEFDAYGARIMKRSRQRARCAIVRLRLAAQKTSVRSDSSASRGSAEETIADSRLLFPARGVVPEIGDMVEVVGKKLTVVRVFPRHTVNGRLDHYEVDADIWVEGV